MSLKLTQCRGQCYDGMDVKKQLNYILAMEKRAVLTHCYGHALNLAVGDSMKQSKVCRDALDAEAFGQCSLQDGRTVWVAIDATMIHSAMQLWDGCLETQLDPDVKGRIIDVQT